MLRFLMRTIGLLALAGGFVAILYDGTLAIAAGEVAITSMGNVLNKVHPNALPRLEAAAEHYAPGWGMRTLSLLLLRPPAAAVLLVAGAIFMVLGRRKRPKERLAG